MEKYGFSGVLRTFFGWCWTFVCQYIFHAILGIIFFAEIDWNLILKSQVFPQNYWVYSCIFIYNSVQCTMFKISYQMQIFIWICKFFGIKKQWKSMEFDVSVGVWTLVDFSGHYISRTKREALIVTSRLAAHWNHIVIIPI